MSSLRSTCAFVKVIRPPLLPPSAPIDVALWNNGGSPMRAATQLQGMKVLDPATTSLCCGYFNSFKVPSVLIASSTFVALFVMGNNVKDTSFMSKREIIFSRLYHVFSLLSLCLSLSTLLSSQFATTQLLTTQHYSTKNVKDAYDFLQSSKLKIEFILTQWTFVTSILFFLKSTCCRMIVEFDLFSKRRRTAGVMVLSMMGGVISAMLSYINLSYSQFSSWPNFWEMTRELGMVSV